MVTQLLEKERIRTTLAKAKTLQRYAEQVITLGKQVRVPSGPPFCQRRPGPGSCAKR